MTWMRARGGEVCGSCKNRIAAGAPLLELRNLGGGIRRVRCKVCAPAITGQPVPEDIPGESIEVPAPSLPLELHRGPDKVTPGKVLQAVIAERKRRQAGET